MLAPGELGKAREERRHRGAARTQRRSQKPMAAELTLTQAMNAGKWELLFWLEARGKTASQDR